MNEKHQKIDEYLNQALESKLLELAKPRELSAPPADLNKIKLREKRSTKTSYRRAVIVKAAQEGWTTDEIIATYPDIGSRAFVNSVRRDYGLGMRETREL